jgi:HK97 family phage portal protein
MSLLFPVRPVPERRLAEDQAFYQAMRAARMGNTAGGSIGTDQALQSPTVAACVHTVASSVSSLELAGYRSADENGMPEPLNRLPRLWREPSAEESPEDWFYKVIQAAMCDGRAWGRIVARDPRMSPTQIELVPDEAVSVKADRSTGAWMFTIDRTPIDPMDMWWMTGVPARHHPFGASLVHRASEPIGVQLAAMQYLRTWFRDGAHPTALIQTEQDLGQEQATSLKQRIRDLTSGSREPLLLPKSVTLNPFQTSPADSEIGDVLMTTATQIATFFLFPPEQVGGSTGSSMTYSNVEQQQIIILQRAVRFWMRKLELSLSRAVRPDSIYAKFDENDLVRTDLKTKFDAIIAATGGPFLTPNEGREMDDRAPMVDGDALRSSAPAPAVRVDDDDEALRSVTLAQQMRSIVSESRGPDTHIHLPDSLQVEMRQEPIIIPAPIVNVPPAQVTVNVEPTPVTVNVPPAEVTVNVPTQTPPIVYVQPQDSGDESITFTRDAQGRIVGAKKVTN